MAPREQLYVSQQSAGTSPALDVNNPRTVCKVVPKRAFNREQRECSNILKRKEEGRLVAGAGT